MKSWVTPAAPNDCTAWSTTREASSAVSTLMAEISILAPLLPTVSISQAVFRTRRRVCSISIRASAIHWRITPWSITGLPKATRPAVRSTIIDSARSATPIARMAWWIRPGPRRAWATAKPEPSSPSSAETGTRTSS